jgi:hypothetical protein
MANPYGITQVDIPGLLGMHQQLKRQRLEDLYTAKKMERQDREDEKDLKFSGLLSKLYAGKSSEGAPAPASKPAESVPASEPPSAPGFDPTIPSGSPLSPEIYPDAVGGPVEPVSMPASSTPQLDPAIFAQMVALNPEQAFKIADHFAKMGKAEREAAKEKNAVMGSAAMHLKSFSAGQARMQAMHQIAPQLIAAGFKPEELQNIDISDAGLQGYSALAMDVDKILANQREDARFGETMRHNRATEDTAAAGLSIRQGALDIARKRAASSGGDGDNSDLNYLLSGD